MNTLISALARRAKHSIILAAAGVTLLSIAFCVARPLQPRQQIQQVETPKAAVAPSAASVYLGPFDESGAPVEAPARRPPVKGERPSFQSGVQQ
jgi:hypothetical protein